MEKISITLPLNAWNVVMNALGQRPFAEVAELIAEIKKQGEAAASSIPSPVADAEDEQQGAA